MEWSLDGEKPPSDLCCSMEHGFESKSRRQSCNCRISWVGIYSYRWSRPSPCSSQDYPKQNHMMKGIVQTLLKIWQTWCPDRFPGEHVPGTDHPVSEEPFPNVQSTSLNSFLQFIPCPSQSLSADSIFKCAPFILQTFSSITADFADKIKSGCSYLVIKGIQ